MLGVTIEKDEWIDLATSDGPVRIVLKKADRGHARLAIAAPGSVRILRSNFRPPAVPRQAPGPHPKAPAARPVPRATLGSLPLYQRERRKAR